MLSMPMEEKGRGSGAPRAARGDAGLVPGAGRWGCPGCTHRPPALAALEPGGRRDVRGVATRCPSSPANLNLAGGIKNIYIKISPK